MLLFSFPLHVSTSEHIASFSIFRGFLYGCSFPVINNMTPEKNYVCVFPEDTRINITWEDRIDLIRKTWGACEKKEYST